MASAKDYIGMGREQNLRELSENVISLFTIWAKSELYEWQFSPFFVIVSEKLVNFSVILHEITEIMGIHDIKDVIRWNAKKHFCVWIFHEFTDPSVPNTHFDWNTLYGRSVPTWIVNLQLFYVEAPPVRVIGQKQVHFCCGDSKSLLQLGWHTLNEQIGTFFVTLSFVKRILYEW